MLELARADSKFLEFRERRPTGATSIVGVTMLMFATLPLLAPGVITSSRAFTALALGGFGLACLLAARPKDKRWQIELGRSGFSIGGRWFESASGHRIVLGGPRTQVPLDGRDEYEARLHLAHGGEHLLLRGPDPAVLLNSLFEIQRRWNLAIAPGWGLPEALFGLAARLPQSVRSNWTFLETTTLRRVEQPRVTLATVLGGAFILSFSLIHISRRWTAGTPTSLVSLLLMASGVGVVWFVSALMVSAKIKFSLEGRVFCVSKYLLGLAVKKQEFRKDQVLGAFAVSPTDAETEARHLLLLTSSGAVAFRCSAAAGIARQLPISF